MACEASNVVVVLYLQVVGGFWEVLVDDTIKFAEARETGGSHPYNKVLYTRYKPLHDFTYSW